MRFPKFPCNTATIIGVGLAMILVVPAIALAIGATIDRDFIADEPRVLNESPLKRPGTVRSKRILAITAGSPVDATPLTRGTEVMIKNYTASGLCVSFVGPTETCAAKADPCTGTAHDFIKAGEAASYPLPRGPRPDDAFGKVCLDAASTVTLNASAVGEGVFVTARN